MDFMRGVGEASWSSGQKELWWLNVVYLLRDCVV